MPEQAQNEPESPRARGIVKWYSLAKGYGFIRPEEGGEDVFVHYSELMGGEAGGLADGEVVSFDLVRGDRGLQAQKVERERGS